jgi:peroxiredoxin
MNKIPSIIVPIIENGSAVMKNLFDYLQNKKIIIFGVPGAFTPTCSEQHLPGFLKLSDQIKKKRH